MPPLPSWPTVKARKVSTAAINSAAFRPTFDWICVCFCYSAACWRFVSSPCLPSAALRHRDRDTLSFRGLEDTNRRRMATSVAWKHFSAEQISCLEAALEHTQCKTLLAVYLGLGASKSDEREGGPGDDDAITRIEQLTDKENIVLDFHYYNYAFCKERRFDARATSTFLSIMRDVLDEDMATNDSKSSLRASFDRFEELILRHAVDRPPWTTGVLCPKDIGAITDYVSNSYYRHFHLYKHIFTTKINIAIEQRHPHGVEEPFVPPPLHAALTLASTTTVAPVGMDRSAVAGGG